MIPEIAKAGLADYVDAFLETDTLQLIKPEKLLRRQVTTV